MSRGTAGGRIAKAGGIAVEVRENTHGVSRCRTTTPVSRTGERGVEMAVAERTTTTPSKTARVRVSPPRRRSPSSKKMP